jgi:hypothetical protein
MTETKGKQQAKTNEKLAEILEKFKTNPEQAADEFASLQKKLGEQGQELGNARKQYEQAAAQAQQYQAYLQQAQPLMQWWNQYGNQVNQMIQNHQRQNQGMQAAATAQAKKTPGYSLLTEEEQEALTQRIAGHLQQQALAPWTQQFAQTAEQVLTQRLQQQQAAFDQKLRAYGDVMWKTLEHLAPAEKLESAKKFQETALQYADPSKLNPMQLANDSLSMHSRLSAAEARAKELEEKLAERERQAVPSFGSAGMFAKNDNQAAPATRDDRMKAAVGAVKEAHGDDGMAALFGR